MKNKKFVLYVALAASLGACSNDNEPQSSPVPDGRTALTVAGGDWNERSFGKSCHRYGLGI